MDNIRCPHCKSMLSIPNEYREDKQLQCSHCGEIFNNYIIKRKKKKQQIRFNKFLIASFICLVFLGLKACVDSYSESSINIGDNVEVIKTTIGLMDEGGVDEFWKSTIAGDRMGVEQLIITGRGRQIFVGEQGKVIERTTSASRVRLNDGAAWWIPTLSDLKKVNE
ncbi:zinc ribbon domain-containing protein [Prevotella intermedia]|nr:hypothetical protein [Prevotella intermedia]